MVSTKDERLVYRQTRSSRELQCQNRSGIEILQPGGVHLSHSALHISVLLVGCFSFLYSCIRKSVTITLKARIATENFLQRPSSFMKGIPPNTDNRLPPKVRVNSEMTMLSTWRPGSCYHFDLNRLGSSVPGSDICIFITVVDDGRGCRKRRSNTQPAYLRPTSTFLRTVEYL